MIWVLQISKDFAHLPEVDQPGIICDDAAAFYGSA